MQNSEKIQGQGWAWNYAYKCPYKTDGVDKKVGIKVVRLWLPTTASLGLVTVRGRAAEVQGVQHIELPRNVPASDFGFQFVDESQNVVKEADAVEEVALDVGRLHRSPALPEMLELSMWTVVFREIF